MCEQKQMTGTRLVVLAGNGRINVAVLVEMGVDEDRSPAVPTRAGGPRSFCLSVDGQVGEAGSDCVSMTT